MRSLLITFNESFLAPWLDLGGDCFPPFPVRYMGGPILPPPLLFAFVYGAGQGGHQRPQESLEGERAIPS